MSAVREEVSMRCLLLSLLILSLSNQGCDDKLKDQLTSQEKEIISQEVEERVTEYLDAFEKLDLDRMLDFWANTDGFVFAGDGTLVAGYNLYTNQLVNAITNAVKVNSIKKESPHIYVLAKDAASYAMQYSWSMKTKSGEVINAQGSWMYVFKKFDETWKVVHSAGTHHYN